MNAERPRALFIAPTIPAEGDHGLAMRVGTFLEAMTRAADVDLLVVPISGPADQRSALLERLAIKPIVVPVSGRGDTRFRLVTLMTDPAARLAAFEEWGHGSRHAAMSAPVLEDVRQVAGKGYHHVHVARLYLLKAGMATGIPSLSLDLDEDDAWAWRHASRLAAEPDRQRWMSAEAAAEDRLMERIPAHARLFISNGLDRRRLRRRHPSLKPEVIPNTVTIPADPARNDDGRTLIFVGNLGYRPNADGLLWFAAEVWPLLPAGTRLLVVGTRAPQSISALTSTPGIEVLGRVDDLAAAYARATLAIAPLHSGGGTRIKLIEAAAHRVPIVTTRLAAQGIGFPPHAVWQADTAEAFAAAIATALGDRAARSERAAASRAFVEKRHNRDREIESLACRFAEILAE